MGRSREGAWIEIYQTIILRLNSAVAPVRERGLKSIEKYINAVDEKSLP